MKQETALAIKAHTFVSKHLHKKNIYVQNDENYLYLLYEGFFKNQAKTKITSEPIIQEIDCEGKIERGFRILNLFDIAQLGLKNISDLKQEEEYRFLSKRNGKNTITLELKLILKVGDRVILYEKHRDEITDKNVKLRLFKIYKFNVVTPTGYLYCQFHLEASPDGELGDGDTKFDPNKYQARLKLSADNFNCLLENLDFRINNDGSIIWI